MKNPIKTTALATALAFTCLGTNAHAEKTFTAMQYDEYRKGYYATIEINGIDAYCLIDTGYEGNLMIDIKDAEDMKLPRGEGLGATSWDGNERDGYNTTAKDVLMNGMLISEVPTHVFDIYNGNCLIGTGILNHYGVGIRNKVMTISAPSE